MPIAPALRALDIDLPACPVILVKLSLMLHDEDADMRSLAELIQADMALASAVVRTVNSAMFGLLRRVESVPEAARYLGTREVAALTFEIGLRGAFPPSRMLEALWDRASKRGLAMGRAAAALEIDPWLAHTAGLFAESGQAALFAHDQTGYPVLLADTPDALSQLDGEVAAYGVHHAALGAALCQSWGLNADVATSVRLRPAVLRVLGGDDSDETPWLAEPLQVQQLLALGAATDALLESNDLATLAHCCQRLAPPAGLDADSLRDSVAASVERVLHAAEAPRSTR